MLSELFTSVADALISYAIDKLDPAERIKSWLKQDPARIAFQKALARAYSAFARQYPEYTSSLFDQSFLSKEALPELSKLLTRSQHPDPALLAQAWGQSIGKDTDFAQTAIKPASYFIKRLEAELKAEPALQALFDSRALESLPKLEAEIQKLASDLKRGLDEALKAANNYQQANIHVGGSVSGDGIVIGHNNQLTINKYDYSTNYYYSGDFVSLNEYYIPPDGVFQRVRVDEFVGRAWLTDKVDAFLNDPSQKSGAFLLVGDAGVGKTAFMAHLVKERRYLHLFAEQVPGQAMLQRALQSLGSQLVSRYQIDPYKDRDTLIQGTVFPDFIERLLRYASGKLTSGEKIVIVCDALDEAGVFPDHFVFGLPKELPDGVYLILSQRPVNTKLPNFEPLRFDLEAQGEDNLQDMEDYLSAVAKRPAVAGQIHAKDYSEDFFIQTLKEKSLGVWMYLHYIIKEIEDGARAPLDLANLPKGLVGYYADYWDDWRYGRKGRGKGEEAWNELYAPLLTTLAAAQDAITAEQLTAWAGVKADTDAVDALLHDKWRSFILEKEVAGNIVYAPYHLSFRDFITGKVDTSKLPIEQANLVRDLAKKTVRAHKRIVNVFEKECNGEWENLVDQDYPRLYLTAHLAGAKEYKKLTNLLTEGGEKIKWAQEREKKEETYAGYLNDLIYVWDYAEREQNYALAIRCMLIENSIHSLASNIPPKLLAELAKEGIWSYARCLSAIRQKLEPSEKAESLKLIAPTLPPLLFQDAISIACEVTNISGYRAKSLFALVPYLNNKLKPQVLQDALSAAREIGHKSTRMAALVTLAPYANEEVRRQLFQESLSIAHENTIASFRVKDLLSLLPYLPSDLKDQVARESLKFTRDIRDEFDRANALTALLPHIQGEIKYQISEDILEIAWGIQEEDKQIGVLSNILVHLPNELKAEVFQKAFEVTHKTRTLDESEYARALSSIAPYLTNGFEDQFLQDANNIREDYWRAYTLSNLIPHLSKDLKVQATQNALTAAYSIQEQSDRATILLYLAPCVIDKQKTQILNDALKSAWAIHDGLERTKILQILLPHLNQEIKSQVLDSTREIQNDYDRASSLLDILPYLTGELKDHAIQETFESTIKIRKESKRSSTLSRFSSYINDDLKSQALSAACEIEDETFRTLALCDLIGCLPDELKPRVLAAVSEIQQEDFRTRIFYFLAPHLTDEIKPQVLRLVLETQDKYNRAKALLEIAPFLTDVLKTMAFQEIAMAIHDIQDESKRVYILLEFATCLPDDLKSDLLSSAREIMDPSSRARALSGIASHLNNELKVQVFKEVLTVTREIQDELERARIIWKFVPFLNDDLEFQVLSVIQEFEDESSLSIALTDIFPYLTNRLKPKAFAIALKLQDEQIRARILSDFVPHLAGKLKTRAIHEALVSIDEIYDVYHRARILSNLAPHLITDKFKTQAFFIAHEIDDEYEKVVALSNLVPYLTDKLKFQAFNAAFEVTNNNKRIDMLIALAPHLNSELKKQALQHALYTIGMLDDKDSPANALSKIAPQLTGDLLDKALIDVRKIKKESSRANALHALIPYFNRETQITLMQEIPYNYLTSFSMSLKKVLGIWKTLDFQGIEKYLLRFIKDKSPDKRVHGVEFVGELIPALIHFSGPKIVPELYRAIMDTARWWP